MGLHLGLQLPGNAYGWLILPIRDEQFKTAISDRWQHILPLSAVNNFKTTITIVEFAKLLVCKTRKVCFLHFQSSLSWSSIPVAFAATRFSEMYESLNLDQPISDTIVPLWSLYVKNTSLRALSDFEDSLATPSFAIPIPFSSLWQETVTMSCLLLQWLSITGGSR